jgi:hypothetical protein
MTGPLELYAAERERDALRLAAHAARAAIDDGRPHVLNAAERALELALDDGPEGHDQPAAAERVRRMRELRELARGVTTCTQ